VPVLQPRERHLLQRLLALSSGGVDGRSGLLLAKMRAAQRPTPVRNVHQEQTSAER
jgi:hypothetical protein